ncbi:YbhB/YbcL family Raf kinase inhibitor-like protein [Ancrocorticia populi]|uniref:YbhB/YbcL family Raf kinase inhibitor-like protein n=1 Tax=Ancrocorticia populi TaxID=2175228 RepID=UPI003F8F5273
MDITRPIAPEPYNLLPPCPSFTLTSTDMHDGEALPLIHTADGANLSPQLSWEGFPEETQSFLVSCFDPDAPTPAGYWHWTILDVPRTTTSLDQGAGSSDILLPDPAAHVNNDASEARYAGSAPPAGDRPHRYIFAVHALDVPTLGLDASAVTATTTAFTALFHTIARVRLTTTYQRP